MLMVYTILMLALPYFEIIGDILFHVWWFLLLIGTILGSVIFLGLYREHGSQLNLAVFIVSLIFPWFLFSSQYLDSFLGAIGLAEIFYPLDRVSFGVVFLLWGFAMLVSRKEFGQSEINLVSGIFFLLVSVSFFDYSIYPVSPLYLIPACVPAIVSLFQPEALK